MCHVYIYIYVCIFHHDTSCKQALAQLVTFSLEMGTILQESVHIEKHAWHADITFSLVWTYHLLVDNRTTRSYPGWWVGEEKQLPLWRGYILAPKWPHVCNRPACLPVVSWIKDLIAMQYGAFIMTQVANRHSLSSSLFRWRWGRSSRNLYT